MRIKEGLAEIETASDPAVLGPGKVGPSFYNRLQRLNRDLTVLVVSLLKPKLYLDAFGGSGIRGIRIKLETETDAFIAEKSRFSYISVLSNIRMNGLRIGSYNGDFVRALREFPFDFVDLDPYGTVVPYLDETIINMRKPGYLGITATDLSALTGSSQASLKRRYGSQVRPGLWMHETGIRNLLSYVARRSAANDCSVSPVLSFWNGHYYRLFLRVMSGRRNANSALSNIGSLAMSQVSLSESGSVGPMWLGNMNERHVVENLSVPDYMKEQKLERLISLLKNEDIMTLFYDTRDLYRKKSSIQPLENVMEIIKNSLSKDAFPTHFSTTGFKTSCEIMDVVEALRLA